MPIALRFTISGEGVTEEAYDQIAEKVNLSLDPPPGLIFHSIGFTDGHGHTFDVWESEEAFQAFMQERLQPAMEQAGIGGAPPEIMTYELHNVWAADPARLEQLSTAESPIAAQRGG